jgi:hypothetical protein
VRANRCLPDDDWRTARPQWWPSSSVVDTLYQGLYSSCHGSGWACPASAKTAPGPSTAGAWRTPTSSPSSPTRPRRRRDVTTTSKIDQASSTCAHITRGARAALRAGRLHSVSQLRSAFPACAMPAPAARTAHKPAHQPKLSLSPPPCEHAPAAVRKKRATRCPTYTRGSQAPPALSPAPCNPTPPGARRAQA